ncbi:Degradation activator [Hartmannibacter diazotrophicus]|uniref:Degradation activator n=1 Tax=Hartmannibacter diazotrophicus TaxID=1482074 RepID=A0A2C9D6J7_9HYPH|nr:LacI family DNA-binding transcriptional regulator [Hartmannibacter diazotrophicus]SON55873.1 Degradation activator [Hartmannibacter diazotrophicus]
MVTLRDVARSAGVSPKTVSRVVNDDPAVTPETRELVRKEIERLNYVPNLAARMMRTATSEVVGLMTDVVATTPYSVEIVRGVQSALRKEGRTLLIANTEGDRQIEAGYWRTFRSHKVGAAIVATMFHREYDVSPEGFDKPLVMVNCFAADNRFDTVLPDDEEGGYTQAKHLLQLGHRRIGVVSLHEAIRATGLRHRGMLRAFAEAGANFDESLLERGAVGPFPDETFVAYEAAKRLLSRPDRPTAIICGNDMLAVQIYAAASEHGLTVPDDLSVIGFDDLPIFSAILRPRLTTVALPYFRMGEMAVDLIAGMKSFAGRPAKQHLVECPLVVRESCRPLA